MHSAIVPLLCLLMIFCPIWIVVDFCIPMHSDVFKLQVSGCYTLIFFIIACFQVKDRFSH